MTFSRVNSGGWATGATLTHGQMNTLDIDHTNAIDKTGENSGGGGGVSGTIEWLSGSTLNVDSGATLNVSGNEHIKNGGSLILDSGSSEVVNSEIYVSNGGEIDCHGAVIIENDGTFTVNSGASVTIYGAGSSLVSMPTAKSYLVNGATGETVKQVVPLYFKDAIYNEGGFTSSGSTGGTIVGGGSNNNIIIPLGALHAGATLNSIDIITATSASSNGGTNAQATLYVRAIATGSPQVNLAAVSGWASSGAILPYGSTNLASYNFSGTAITIGSATYGTAGTYGAGAQFAISIVDDSNSAGVNKYYQIVLHYTIASLEWP